MGLGHILLDFVWRIAFQMVFIVALLDGVTAVPLMFLTVKHASTLPIVSVVDFMLTLTP